MSSFLAIETKNSMNSKQKPVAIVTGASIGIGLRITLAFIKHGYDVVGTSLSISKSKEPKASSDLVLIDGDISKKETTVTVAAAAMEQFGRIDLLVNNAGIFIDDHAAVAKFHPLGRMAEISDVVDAVLYLQNATFVTGENIRVDGGIHAGR
jgi:NAD(P)-dependent dehydrogenase (short-subunit alcohol dehydrogenase family)